MTPPFTGLPPLATTADATRLGYTLPAATADALLDRASVRVRAYTRQTVTRVEADTVSLRPVHGAIILPQRPADRPTTIMADDGFGLTWNIPGFWWDGRRVRCPHQAPAYQLDQLFRLYAAPFSDWTYWPYQCLCVAPLAWVTYSHGWTSVPDEITDVVCAIAERLGNTEPGMEAGIRTESVGDYSITYGVDSLQSASGLLPGEKLALDRIFGRPRMGTIPLT